MQYHNGYLSKMDYPRKVKEFLLQSNGSTETELFMIRIETMLLVGEDSAEM